MVQNIATAAINPGLPPSAAKWIAVGAGLAMIGVGTGAFGAHGLQGYLESLAQSDPELAARRMDNWETAAQYQLLHSIGLVLTGLVMARRPSQWLQAAAIALLMGVLLFSGLLYLLVLTERPVLGAFVPIGGVSMMVGWALLAVGTLKQPAAEKK